MASRLWFTYNWKYLVYACEAIQWSYNKHFSENGQNPDFSHIFWPFKQVPENIAPESHDLQASEYKCKPNGMVKE